VRTASSSPKRRKVSLPVGGHGGGLFSLPSLKREEVGTAVRHVKIPLS